MVQLALAGDFVPFAVNVDAAEANETLRPFLPLAERLGRLFASLCRASVPDHARGVLPRATSPATTPASSRLAALKGFFGAISDEPVTLRERPAAGQGQRASRCARPTAPTSADFVNLVTLRGGGHSHRRARSSAGAASSAS